MVRGAMVRGKCGTGYGIFCVREAIRIVRGVLHGSYEKAEREGNLA